MQVTGAISDAAFSPHSYRAELAIIGHAIIWQADVMQDLARTVKPEDFYSTVYRALYAGALDLWRRGEPINQTTLYHELVATKRWQACMDTEMAECVVACTNNPATAVYCARWVRELADRRRQIEAGTKQVADAVEGKKPTRGYGGVAVDM